LEAKIYVRESRLEVHWLASADSLHPHRFVQRATQIQHGSLWCRWPRCPAPMLAIVCVCLNPV
jgi:hypothetical protein